MDSFDHVVVDEDDGAFVKCKGDACECKTQVRDVLLQCSSEVKMDLLKSVVADADIGYWASKVELIAASQNVPTNDLVSVIRYRADVMHERAAMDLMAALTTGPAAVPVVTNEHAAPPHVRIDSSEQSDASEDSAITKLVWFDERSPTTKEDFSYATTMGEVEAQAEKQKKKGEG